MLLQRRYITHFSMMISLLLLVEVGSAQNVISKLKSNSQTSHFGRALEQANLQERLNQSGPFTLFAPSNAVFDKLSSGQKSDRQLLLNHIFTGMATERSLKAMSEVTCLSGQTLSIVVDNSQRLKVNDVLIVRSNIRADNGVIHIIEGVIK